MNAIPVSRPQGVQQKRRQDLRAGGPGSGRGAGLQDFGRTRRSLPIINARVFLENNFIHTQDLDQVLNLKFTHLTSNANSF